MMLPDSLKDAIVTVGEGRGFVVGTRRERFVVTAAHCLPHLPPPHSDSLLQKRTYRDLIGPRGGALTVWAECVFVDPVADLAVLRGPDDQRLSDEDDDYQRFVEGRPSLSVAKLAQRVPAWVLTLDGQWDECAVEDYGRTQTLFEASISQGMSGSPILTSSSSGHAVGVVALKGLTGTVAAAQHMQPSLVASLPGWLLTELSVIEHGKNKET